MRGRISQTFSWLNTKSTILASWLLMLIVVLLVADVIWRVFFEPLHAMVELSVFAMMVVIALGIAACEEHGEHVRLDFFVDKLPNLLRRLTVRISRLLSVLAAMVLVVAIYRDGVAAYVSRQTTEGLVQMPLWPVKFIMIAGVFFLLVEVFRTLTKPLDQDHRDNDQPGLS